MHRWYIVHTKPFGEASAELNLRRQGYTVYFPRLVQAARWGGKLRERTVALFPRYLFLQLREGWQSLAPVHSTIGVSSVVRFGSCYVPVPDAVVKELRSRADPHSGLHRVRGPQLSRGCKVRIAGGAFAGLEAVFEHAAGADRVIVLLQLLGQEAAVRIPRDFVLPGVVAT